MRKDGYSASYIHVQLGIHSRADAARIIREAGIVDSASYPDPRYPLRCAKCKEHGHTEGQCEKGDALDQLDAQEKDYKKKRNAALSVEKFQQIKIAIHHQLDPETIAREMHIDLKEVTKAELARTYEEYCEK